MPDSINSANLKFSVLALPAGLEKASVNGPRRLCASLCLSPVLMASAPGEGVDLSANLEKHLAEHLETFVEAIKSGQILVRIRRANESLNVQLGLEAEWAATWAESASVRASVWTLLSPDLSPSLWTEAPEVPRLSLATQEAGRRVSDLIRSSEGPLATVGVSDIATVVMRQLNVIAEQLSRTDGRALGPATQDRRRLALDKREMIEARSLAQEAFKQISAPFQPQLDLLARHGSILASKPDVGGTPKAGNGDGAFYRTLAKLRAYPRLQRLLGLTIDVTLLPGPSILDEGEFQIGVIAKPAAARLLERAEPYELPAALRIIGDQRRFTLTGRPLEHPVEHLEVLQFDAMGMAARSLAQLRTADSELQAAMPMPEPPPPPHGAGVSLIYKSATDVGAVVTDHGPTASMLTGEIVRASSQGRTHCLSSRQAVMELVDLTPSKAPKFRHQIGEIRDVAAFFHTVLLAQVGKLPPDQLPENTTAELLRKISEEILEDAGLASAQVQDFLSRYEAGGNSPAEAEALEEESLGYEWRVRSVLNERVANDKPLFSALTGGAEVKIDSLSKRVRLQGLFPGNFSGRSMPSAQDKAWPLDRLLVVWCASESLTSTPAVAGNRVFTVQVPAGKLPGPALKAALGARRADIENVGLPLALSRAPNAISGVVWKVFRQEGQLLVVSLTGVWRVKILKKPADFSLEMFEGGEFQFFGELVQEKEGADLYLTIEMGAWERLGEGFVGEIRQQASKQWASVRMSASSLEQVWTATSLDFTDPSMLVSSVFDGPQQVEKAAKGLLVSPAEPTLQGRVESTADLVPRFGRLVAMGPTSGGSAKTVLTLDVPSVGVIQVEVPSPLSINGQIKPVETLSQHGDLWIELSSVVDANNRPQTSIWMLSDPVEVSVLVVDTKTIHLAGTRLPHGQVWIDSDLDKALSPAVELHIEIPWHGDGPRLPAVILHRFQEIARELIPNEKLLLRARVENGEFVPVWLQRPAAFAQGELAIALAVSAQDEERFLVRILDKSSSVSGACVSATVRLTSGTGGHLVPRLGDLIWIEFPDAKERAEATFRPATQRAGDRFQIWGRAIAASEDVANGGASVQTAFGLIPFAPGHDAELLKSAETFPVHVQVIAAGDHFELSITETRAIGSLVALGALEKSSWWIKALLPTNSRGKPPLLPYPGDAPKLGHIATTAPDQPGNDGLDLLGKVLEANKSTDELRVQILAWKHPSAGTGFEPLPLVTHRKCLVLEGLKGPFLPAVGQSILIRNGEEVLRIAEFARALLLPSELQHAVIVAQPSDTLWIVRGWKKEGDSYRRFDFAVQPNGSKAAWGTSVSVESLFTDNAKLKPLSAPEDTAMAAQLKKIPVEELSFVSDAILSWNHWSVLTENPLFPPPVEESPEFDPDGITSVPAATAHTHVAHYGGVPDGSLPRMRYGNRYELSLPYQDLAGNVSTPDNSDLIVKHPVPFTCLRSEPISAPLVYKVSGIVPELRGLQSNWQGGEFSLDIVVSGEGNLPASAELWVFPPPVAPATWLAHSDAPPDVSTPADEPLANINGDRLAPIDSEVTLSYPPDPAAEKIVVRCVRYGETQELRASVPAVQSGRVQAIRLGVRSTSNKPCVLQPGAGSNTMLLQIPKGESCLLEISTAPSEKLLEEFLLRDWTKGIAGADSIRSSMLWGRMPLISGCRRVLVTHAVLKTLQPPKMVLHGAPFQTFGSANLPVACSLSVHAPSTGKLRIRAEWEEHLDDPGEALPAVPLKSAQELFDPITENFPDWQGFLEYCRNPGPHPERHQWLVKNRAFLQQSLWLQRFRQALISGTEKAAFVQNLQMSAPEADAPLNNTVRADFLHQFDDCRSRKVYYRAQALSRHLDQFYGASYVPKSTDWIPEIKDPASGVQEWPDSVRITSMATLPPSAPEVAYMIPLFGRSYKTGSTDVTELYKETTRIQQAIPVDLETAPGLNTPSLHPGGIVEAQRYIERNEQYRLQVATYERRSLAIRVYLRRPWYTSGDGERLAVVLSGAEKPDRELRRHISEWGYDPVWHLPDDPGVKYPPLKLEDFEFRVDREEGIPLLESGGSRNHRVVVAAHDVRFCTARGLWYCDIRIKPAAGIFRLYGAFLRLCLARYQGNAIEGARLSEVVATDFIQLQPDRVLSIVSEVRGKRFLLHGDFPATDAGNARREVFLHRLQTGQDANMSTLSPGSPAQQFKLKQEGEDIFYECFMDGTHNHFAVVEAELHSSAVEPNARRIVYMERVELQ